jgi:hypothetical protein
MMMHLSVVCILQAPGEATVKGVGEGETQGAPGSEEGIEPSAHHRPCKHGESVNCVFVSVVRVRGGRAGCSTHRGMSLILLVSKPRILHMLCPKPCTYLP